MAIQSQGQRVAIAAIGAAYGIYPPPTVRSALLEFTYVTAVASGGGPAIGIGRPATNGIPSGPLPFIQDDLADPASVVNGCVTWFAQPTVPAIFYRRWSTSAVAGIGVVWTFPRGLIIPGNGAVVMFTFTVANATGDITATVDA